MARRVAALRSVKGRRFAVTGKCSVGRRELVDRIRQKGGIVEAASANVTQTTDVLVRGASDRWKYGDFGKKEAQAAENVRKGIPVQLVDADDLLRLLKSGRAAPFLETVAGLKRAWLEPASDNEVDRALRYPGALDREYTVLGRAEQKYLRQSLLRGRGRAPCSLCGLMMPAELLVAAHIKPRAHCTSKERSDGAIAFLLCVFGCDALYERGYIVVLDGRVAAKQLKSEPRAVSMRLRELDGRQCRAWRTETAEFFIAHARLHGADVYDE